MAGALPEMLAEHAILVDQLDVASIVEGIEKALSQDGEKPAKSKSQEMVARYTWSKTAEDVMQVFLDVGHDVNR
jgi:trehalose-6-phosphate synthase